MRSRISIWCEIFSISFISLVKGRIYPRAGLRAKNHPIRRSKACLPWSAGGRLASSSISSDGSLTKTSSSANPCQGCTVTKISCRAACSSAFCCVFICLEGFLDWVEWFWPFLTRHHDLWAGDLMGEDETSFEGGSFLYSCKINLMIIEDTLGFEGCFVVLKDNSSGRYIRW